MGNRSVTPNPGIDGTDEKPTLPPDSSSNKAPDPVKVGVAVDTTVPSEDQRKSPHIKRALSAGLLTDSVLQRQTEKLKDVYNIGKKLGQGQFGTTYLCTEKATGDVYACKSISKRKLLTEEDVEDVRREIRIMHHLAGHPNVISITGAYEDAVSVHVVMECCAGGELFDRIIRRGHYSEKAAADLARVIVSVVETCHSLGVMHRDLKPENFLFLSQKEESSLKTIDFGLSIFFKPGEIFTDVVGSPYYVAPEVLRKRYSTEADVWSAGVIIYILLSGIPPFWDGEIFTDVVGSPYYVAPEVLRKRYSTEADVWSAGVIIYILLSGIPPFWDENEQGIFEQVLKGELDFSTDPWPSISESAKDLVKKMLVRDPKKRLTAHEVLCHPWVCVDGVAPDKPLDSAVLTRLKQFSAMNKFKKLALRVIAESLSEEELAGLKEMFKMIDTDNSGQITLEELKAGLERVGANLMDSEISALMNAADIDNSGTLDYGEFIAATMHLNKIEREENLFSSFSYFDKDGSGYITQDELQQACVEFGITDFSIEEIMGEVDQDHDGRIDYNEFAEMMQMGNANMEMNGSQTNFNIDLRGALKLN